MTRRIVVACSGGSSSTVALAALAREPHAEIVAVTLDLGQARDLEEVRERALQAGAVRAHVLDVRDEFATGFVLPVLQAGVQFEDRPAAIPLAQPLIAMKLLEIADIEDATGVAHGCTDGDELRMERSITSLRPDMSILAAGSTPAAVGYVRGNLWGRTIRYAGAAAPAAHPVTTADAPAVVAIEFHRGAPRAINGVPLSLTELIDSVSTIAAQHGVGRTVTPGKSGGRIDEAPAAVVLHAAHDALEAATSPADLIALRAELRQAYGRLLRDGLWFTRSREALDALNRVAEDAVTGIVRVELHNGRLAILNTSVPFAVNHAFAIAPPPGATRLPIGTT